MCCLGLVSDGLFESVCTAAKEYTEQTSDGRKPVKSIDAAIAHKITFLSPIYPPVFIYPKEI